MAVAIWDHSPTPQELLDGRFARGWRPTPTETVEGGVVLGYAACASGQCELPGKDNDMLGRDREG